MAAILDVKMAANMAANSATIPWNFWTAWAILLKFDRYVYYMILYMFLLVGLQKFKMATVTTTKPHKLWTVWPIMLKFCWYVNYMILHMFHLLIYKNSGWPPSWLPIWPPLQLQNLVTCEPLDQLCSNFVDMSTIWSYICSICLVTKIQDGRHHGRH